MSADPISEFRLFVRGITKEQILWIYRSGEFLDTRQFFNDFFKEYGLDSRYDSLKVIRQMRTSGQSSYLRNFLSSEINILISEGLLVTSKKGSTRKKLADTDSAPRSKPQFDHWDFPQNWESLCEEEHEKQERASASLNNAPLKDNPELLNDIAEYKKRINDLDNYPALRGHVKARKAHNDRLSSISSDSLKSMSQAEFEKFFDNNLIWSAQRRSTIHYIIEDNGFAKVQNYFVKLYELVENGQKLDDDLWSYFVNALKNVSNSWFTEILAALDNENYVLYNRCIRDPLMNYGVSNIQNISFRSYRTILDSCREISQLMQGAGMADFNLCAVDGFLNYKETLMQKDSETNYWFYAPGENASAWEEMYESQSVGIGWEELGDLNGYDSKEEISDELIKKNLGSRANPIWYFAKEMKAGDVVFARKGRRMIIGYGVIKGKYQYDKGAERFCNIRSIEWTRLDEPVETLNKTMMDTVSRVPNDSIQYLLEKCGLRQTADNQKSAPNPNAYSINEILSETFLNKSEFETIKNLLERKKNVILKGAPGVGKTYVARRIAYAMMKEKASDRIQLVQFHQNYSYEEFIIGYKPNGSEFTLEPGTFFKFCEKAREDRENSYFFIIDEINRGNLSKIFGEMLVLIESDKREGTEDGLTIKTAYGDKDFSVPDNVYIIGMMNTADRSLAIIDYALRRRFAFFTLKPRFVDDEGNVDMDFVERLHTESSISLELAKKICENMKAVNEKIASSLDPGYCIGHSFFIRNAEDDESGATEDEWYHDVVDYEIQPLLEEYFFDQPEVVKQLLNRLNS